MGEGFPRSPEITRPTSEPVEQAAAPRAETYDKAYWTPDRIRRSVLNFFEKLERNEQRFRAEQKILLEKAVKEKEVRRQTQKEIAEREMREAELQRREQFQRELNETETQRHFRHTIEWMMEQKHDQIHDLALSFLQGNSGTSQTIKEE